MINSKDTKIVKELVVSALFQVAKNTKQYLELKPIVQKVFDVVINEMEQGKI